MNKNWKKRFKKFFFDIDNHLEIMGGSILSGLLFGVGSLFVLDESFYGHVFVSSAIAVAGFMYTSIIGQILLSEESMYDEKQKENKQKIENIEKENVEKEKKEIQDYYFVLLSNNNKRYKTGDKEVWLPISELLDTVSHIKKSYALTEEEKEYVTQKVTKDVYDLVQIYEKLTYQNKKEYQIHMIAVAKEKKEELQRNFVDRFQNQIKQEFERKQQEVQTQRYQHVYMND